MVLIVSICFLWVIVWHVTCHDIKIKFFFKNSPSSPFFSSEAQNFEGLVTSSWSTHFWSDSWLELRHQRGVPPLKKRYFAAICFYSVKTVAGRYRLAAFSNKHWWRAFQICQHRWPWTTLNPQKRGFVEFFAFFGCSAHFNSELRRNGRR